LKKANIVYKNSFQQRHSWLLCVW